MSIDKAQAEAFLEDYKKLVIKHGLYIEGCDEITFLSTVKEGAEEFNKSEESFIDRWVIQSLREGSNVD